jgi:hypothetical protein
VADPRQLGGRHLHGGNADEDGRHLLNVVEEMSLASACPRRTFTAARRRRDQRLRRGPPHAVLGVTQAR